MVRKCICSFKVHPHYAVWHTVAQRSKAAQQKSHHAASIYGHCVGSAAACHSMLRPKNSIGKLSVPSKEAARHRGFKMVSASLRKKSDKVHRSCSTVFVTSRSAKNFFSCRRDRIGGICPATFAAQQSCRLLHSVARHSVDAPLRVTTIAGLGLYGRRCYHLTNFHLWVIFPLLRGILLPSYQTSGTPMLCVSVNMVCSSVYL